MSKKRQLKVYYDSEDINTELDKAIEMAVKPFGYERWASGYSIPERKRDLAFDKEEL